MDVEQSYVSGEDKSCLTAIFAESERLQKAQETNVPQHVNRIVAVFFCPYHRGKQLVHLTHHHGSTQVPKKVLHRGISEGSVALAILSTQGNLALFSKD